MKKIKLLNKKIILKKMQKNQIRMKLEKKRRILYLKRMKKILIMKKKEIIITITYMKMKKQIRKYKYIKKSMEKNLILDVKIENLK